MAFFNAECGLVLSKRGNWNWNAECGMRNKNTNLDNHDFHAFISFCTDVFFTALVGSLFQSQASFHLLLQIIVGQASARHLRAQKAYCTSYALNIGRKRFETAQGDGRFRAKIHRYAIQIRGRQPQNRFRLLGFHQFYFERVWLPHHTGIERTGYVGS